ncbi:MAG: hypothetical protein ACXAEU_24015 [Candidatus Hodarchaeales archaeon]|jgi:hypothetical protein
MNDSLFVRLHNVSNNAKFLREKVLSLPESDSNTLMQLEKAVTNCDRYGEIIDQILEDDKMTPDEFLKLNRSLEELQDITSNIAINNNENEHIINLIFNFCKKLPKMLSKVQYLEDIDHRVFPDGYDSRKKTGYTIDDNVFYETIELMISMFDDSNNITSGEKSSIELEIINIARLIGLLEKHSVMNVLYIKPNSLMNETKNAINRLVSQINQCISLIKENYFREQIKEGITALEHLSTTSELRSGRDLKLRGIFTTKKGVQELGNLAYFLDLID